MGAKNCVWVSKLVCRIEKSVWRGQDGCCHCHWMRQCAVVVNSYINIIKVIKKVKKNLPETQDALCLEPLPLLLLLLLFIYL
jgi:hypothetical protein